MNNHHLNLNKKSNSLPYKVTKINSMIYLMMKIKIVEANNFLKMIKVLKQYLKTKMKVISVI